MTTNSTTSSCSSAPEERATPSDMDGIYLRGRDGGLVQLEALASVKEGVGRPPAQPLQPDALRHDRREPGAGLHPGRGDRLAQCPGQGSTAQGVEHGALRRERASWRRAGGALYFAFVLALVVVFMVLASQFESLMHPFTVLLAVPLAVTGALLTLLICQVDDQPLQPDRDDPADRARDQELDPAGRVRQPAPGTRA